MGREQQGILRALLVPLFDADQPLLLPNGASPQTVLAMARHHRLSPALSMVHAPGLSPFLLDAFRGDRLVTLGRGTLLRQALNEVIAALHTAGLQAAVLKGMAYEALIYPVPGTRPATDIDLLVRPAARARAFDVFRSLGFQPAGGGPGFDEPDYHEVSLRRDEIYIDLHFGLAPFARGAIDYDALWAATIPLWPTDDSPARALSRPHAALHQALHMAIHHFDIPGIYLLDLARLAAAPAVSAQAADTARTWRCLRAWETATALAAAFIPAARAHAQPPAHDAGARINRVVQSFGGLAALPRSDQLRRKIEHFDTALDACRYLAAQGRRVLRERLLEALSRPPSPAERLRW